MTLFNFVQKPQTDSSIDINRYTIQSKENSRPIFIKLTDVSVHHSIEKNRVSVAIKPEDKERMTKIFNDIHNQFCIEFDENAVSLPLTTRTYRSTDGQDLLIFRASPFSKYYVGTTDKSYERPPLSFSGDVLLKVSQLTEGEAGLGIALSLYEASVKNENRRRLLIDSSVECL